VTDVAVIGQDPRFGGGAFAQMEAFWNAVASLGRKPELFYVQHPSLTAIPAREPLTALGISAPTRRLDAANQWWAARHLPSHVRSARSLWVVATTAQYGAAATRVGRRYACWVGTSLDDEWRPQLRLLPRSRRLARRINGPILRRLERQTLRGAELLFATSEASRSAVSLAAGLPSDAIGIIPLPVDTDAFTPTRDEAYEAGLNAPRIVFVGRVDDPRKNVRLLLEAWRLAHRRMPDAALRLIGPSPHLDSLPGVEVVGPAPSVAAELRSATLLVIPSVQEGFGIVAAEALAAGVPVISTPCGGPEDLLRRSGGGVVVEDFAPENLAAAILSALSDPDRLKEMRMSGRRYVVEEHSIERTRSAVARALAALDVGDPS
jgi:glycosyltransferase involved in cell wall biosynthesis